MTRFIFFLITWVIVTLTRSVIVHSSLTFFEIIIVLILNVHLWGHNNESVTFSLLHIIYGSLILSVLLHHFLRLIQRLVTDSVKVIIKRARSLFEVRCWSESIHRWRYWSGVQFAKSSKGIPRYRKDNTITILLVTFLFLKFLSLLF